MSSHLKAVTNETFDREVLQSEVPVLVDFWGDGCPPCAAIKPVLESLTHELAGRAKIVTLKVQDEIELGMKFRIEAIPTLVVIKGGAEVARIRGLASRERILEMLERVAAE